MSFTLKAFAMAAPNLIPRMLTIYFSMKGLDGHCGRRESLGKTVFDEICRILAVPVGVEPAVEQIDFRQSIVDILVNMDFHLMLLVDDVQHMYTFDGDRHQNAIDTLGDLSFFADQPSGRVLVVLCGDVAFTEKLVSHTFDRSTTFAQNFPLLRTGGYRLTKFQVFRISSTIPTDLEAVASITNVQLNNQNRNWLRLVTFMSGCCASDVERFKNELGIGHLAPRCSGCLDGYTIIYDKLYKKNKKLCDALFRGALDNTCTCSILDNIMTAPWERTFQPVTRSAVVFSIRRLVSRGKMDKRHLDCFDDYIEDIANINMSNIHIYDKSIYPSSMYTLMLHVLKRGFEPAVVDRFRAIVRDLPANAAAILGNPRVIAAVATSPAPAAGCTMI